jgi:hypothetical protein
VIEVAVVRTLWEIVEGVLGNRIVAYGYIADGSAAQIAHKVCGRRLSSSLGIAPAP